VRFTGINQSAIATYLVTLYTSWPCSPTTRSACSMTSPWTSSMSTSEYRSVDAESDLPISSGTRRAGQSAVRGQHSPGTRQPATDGARRPARHRARYDGRGVRPVGRRPAHPIRSQCCAGNRLFGHLPARANFTGPEGVPTADGAGGSARQRAGHDGGTSAAEAGAAVADPFLRPAQH